MVSQDGVGRLSRRAVNRWSVRSQEGVSDHIRRAGGEHQSAGTSNYVSKVPATAARVGQWIRQKGGAKGSLVAEGDRGNKELCRLYS